MAAKDVKPDALKASVRSVDYADKRLNVSVRLSNTAPRALHYIADVRATRYDPGTRTLTLALSDEGRELIPGTINKPPVFRHIDPGSEAEIQVSVPDKIVKLSRSAPPGELAFESHGLDDIDEVVVEVGWADVPFYKDTRERARKDARLPAVRWEQHKARATQRTSRAR
jgi:hypothetical protein